MRIPVQVANNKKSVHIFITQSIFVLISRSMYLFKLNDKKGQIEFAIDHFLMFMPWPFKFLL